MPVVHAADAVIHDMHGSRFTSYAAPSRGSAELCAWRRCCHGTTPAYPIDIGILNCDNGCNPGGPAFAYTTTI